MKYFRWVLLGIYVFIFVGLYVLTLTYDRDLALWLFPLQALFESIFWVILFLTVTLITMFLFIFGTGAINLKGRVVKPRLHITVIIAGFIMAFLVMGVCVTATDISGNKEDTWFFSGPFWAIIGISWIVWSFYLFFRNRKAEPFWVAKKILVATFIGSIGELLISIASYINIRFPDAGFLEGLYSAIGIIHGILALLWTLGTAMILFLFLQDSNKKRLSERIQTG